MAASLRRSWPSTAENISPEQRQQVHKAALALLDTQLLERRKQADEAEAALESLRVQLAVPDEIVIQNSDAALDDPRLSNYRAYFEIKRDRDRIRGFARILETKLAIEKVELSIPRAP